MMWSLLAICLLLNMFVAIIMESYGSFLGAVSAPVPRHDPSLTSVSPSCARLASCVYISFTHRCLRLPLKMLSRRTRADKVNEEEEKVSLAEFMKRKFDGNDGVEVVVSNEKQQDEKDAEEEDGKDNADDGESVQHRIILKQHEPRE